MLPSHGNAVEVDNFDVSSSESEEEDELEVQYWRKERHFHELYLESIQVSFFTMTGLYKLLLL